MLPPARLLLTSLAFLIPLFLGAQNFRSYYQVSTNLISPFESNISAELNYQFSPQSSVLASIGVLRSYETVSDLQNGKCTEDRGFGGHAGFQYFFKAQNEELKKGVDGLGIKSYLSYEYNDQRRQTCPSLVPMTLYNTHRTGISLLATGQKVYWNRISVGAELGVGGFLSFRKINFTGQGSQENTTNFDWGFPLGIRLGVII